MNRRIEEEFGEYVNVQALMEEDESDQEGERTDRVNLIEPFWFESRAQESILATSESLGVHSPLQ